jgi:hypothetical protein
VSAVACFHCGETAADAPLLCWCGPTVTCSLCDGTGCRFCGGEGWYAAENAPEAVEDAEVMDAWDWDIARAEARGEERV